MSEYVELSDFKRPKSMCGEAAYALARKTCDNLGLELEDTMELAEEIQVLIDNCIKAVEQDRERND